MNVNDWMESGRSCCLHLSGLGELERVSQRLGAMASDRSKSISFSGVLRWTSVVQRVWWRNKTCSWFALQTGVTQEKAREVVGSLPMKTSDQLTMNAGDPRRLLSVAALLHANPKADFIVYTTVGCSLRGVNTIHDYVCRLASGCCIIHLSTPGYCEAKLVRKCPRKATCFSSADWLDRGWG